MGRLSGKTALVTGAGRGIGRGIALRLAKDGARVGINYSRSEAQARSLAEEIAAAGGQAFLLKADITDMGEIETMFAELRQHSDHLDILVNNAGRGSGGFRTTEKWTPEQYDDVFGLNTRAMFFVTQAAWDLMSDGGRIINLSSTASQVRMKGLAAYAGSKAAVEAMTRVWAAELAPRHITVNCILPGIIDTDLIRDGMSPERVQRLAAGVPLGRIGQPDDVADVVAFLASDEGRWISGQDITVSGGA